MAEVPTDSFILPLGKAEVVRPGKDVTVLGWGAQMTVLEKAVAMAEKDGIDCELIDLQTIQPWDVETVVQSVRKTGKLVVSHEAPITCGFGAEVAATVQVCSGFGTFRCVVTSLKEKCFLNLEAPVRRVCGYDTPFPLVHEAFYLPDELKNYDAIKETVHY